MAHNMRDREYLVYMFYNDGLLHEMVLHTFISNSMKWIFVFDALEILGRPIT